MDQALEAFGQQARSWSPFFVARARVVLAMREDDGWHLWYSYTAYLRELPTTFEKCDVRTENVRAFREVVPFGDAVNAERTITELLQHPGRIDVDGSNLELGPTTQHLRFEYEPLHLSRFAGPSRLPALTAYWHNQNYRTFAYTKELDQELQRYESPYDGFADLAGALGIPVGFDDLNKRRFSEVVLLTPALLHVDANENPRSELSKGELSLVLKAHPDFEPAEVRFGIKAFRQRDVPDRFTIESRAVERDPEGFLRAKHTLSSPDVPIVQVFVSKQDELIGKWWVRDFGNSFNDRMLLHRSLDVTDQLKTSFFDRPEQFEDRVLLALTLMGLNALKYGKILTNGPDILAMSASRHVFVVECTTGDINSRGKLQRLSERAKQINERLSNSSNPPVGVVPIIFTSLMREDTAMHWETAATFRIAIVARENIVRFLDLLDAPVSPDQLYSSTLSLIPSKKVEGQGELGIT
ncbi:hypothetical protein ABIB75_001515 [Bradyrhizobium sp. GM2.2]|uniref:hypothetical protein n=1 Tax=Bradyrhizobium sp. GM2.2 TaxID=3156358 RepID=UPI0033953FD8